MTALGGLLIPRQKRAQRIKLHCSRCNMYSSPRTGGGSGGAPQASPLNVAAHLGHHWPALGRSPQVRPSHIILCVTWSHPSMYSYSRYALFNAFCTVTHIAPYKKVYSRWVRPIQIWCEVKQYACVLRLIHSKIRSR